MSLFSSIQLANNSLRAAQVGLQVVGQNIANVNTPGYIREEALFAPADTQRQGDLLLGMGVEVVGIVQKLDHFLEERLRGATSERAGAEVQEQAYLQLEGLLGELSDTDLSTALTKFFNSISEVVNQPENLATRNLAVLQGQTLAGEVRRLADRVNQNRIDLNRRVINIADDINRLTKEIQTLNLRIAVVEGGELSQSDAVGLRDQRLVALTNLSKLVDIRVAEQSSGGVAVFVGGEFLVFEGERREVAAESTSDRGIRTDSVLIADTNSPLNVNSGELAGLLDARDSVLGGFLDNLDHLAGTLAYEFNKVHSQGQGLNGFTDLTSSVEIGDAGAALSEADLKFGPTSGALDVVLFNRETGQTKAHTIQIDLDGLGSDTSLEDFAAAVDAIDGISASASASGLVTIRSDSPDAEFSFSGDTSGLLAALGLNTFFTGDSALSLDVNQALRDDPSKLATARLHDPETGTALNFGENNLNAIELVRFFDKPLDSNNGASINVLQERLISEVTRGSTVAKSVAEGFRIFEETLNGQKLATSGVSLDEEAVRMLSYQRMFQASARYIATLSELLELLVNL
ncbi:MAG: flagellar hook-associated protein FlgK [Pirellulales bacterium]